MITMIPAFAAAMVEFSSLGILARVGLLLVPSTYPVIAQQRLLFGGADVLLIGGIYQTIFAFVVIWLTARAFSSDRLVAG